MTSANHTTPEPHPAPSASAPDASPQPSTGDPGAEEATADLATPVQPVDPLTAARATSSFSVRRRPDAWPASPCCS